MEGDDGDEHGYRAAHGMAFKGGPIGSGSSSGSGSPRHSLEGGLVVPGLGAGAGAGGPRLTGGSPHLQHLQQHTETVSLLSAQAARA